MIPANAEWVGFTLVLYDKLFNNRKCWWRRAIRW